MRLLKASSASGTLELAEFWGKDCPPYAILSHTWGDDEVQFADLKLPGVSAKAGYQKIRWTLDQAQRDGLGYAWVDTCINKDSIAELSEAVNAMYLWYSQAAVCYAYLSDVGSERDISWDSQFRLSRWFTRGWTLQELLAPRRLVFYSNAWECSGTMTDLAPNVEAATGITKNILYGIKSIYSASIAQRMSWAASRNTTRVEDLAYCLMGLFDINMPLLYGEGSKAFIRLQEEIMKDTDDQTLFAWRASCDSAYHGLLADSPYTFRESAHVVPISGLSSERRGHTPHAMTNRGLRLECPSHPLHDGGLFAYLECEMMHSSPRYIGLALYPTGESTRHYLRSSCHRFQYTERPSADWTSIYVRQNNATFLGTGSFAFHLNSAFHLVQIDRFDIHGTSGAHPKISKAAYLDVLGEGNSMKMRNAGFLSRQDGAISIAKQANLLSAYLGLPKSVFGVAVVLIGTDSLGQLAFDVHEATKEVEISSLVHDQPGYNPRSTLPPHLVAAFEPQSPETVMHKLRDYELQVSLGEDFEPGRRINAMDICCWKKERPPRSSENNGEVQRSSENKGTVQTLWRGVKGLGGPKAD